MKKNTNKFEKKIGTQIDDESYVKVKRMNNIVEVCHVSKVNRTLGLNFTKLNADQYRNNITGEIFDYEKSENRADNTKGLKTTFRNIRDLINNNFVGAENEIHITLTYKENMTDPRRLKKDFEKFWKKFKYRYGDHFDYISIIEPQGRGAWHSHLLVRSNKDEKLFIPFKAIVDMWGHGTSIKVKALHGVDNIGAYLSAYLADIEITDENKDAIPITAQIEEKEVDGQKKKFIKGGRLHLYPPGMNIIRKSKGIIYPDIEKMKYRDIKRELGQPPKFSRTVTITNEEGILLNEISYEQYNISEMRCKDDTQELYHMPKSS